MQVNDIHNDIERVLISAEELEARVAELGAQISADFAGRNPLFVGVLKGCFVFMADLMRHVSIHCSMDFMAVSSYGNSTKTTGAVKINKDLSQDIEGRDVILVEDILHPEGTFREGAVIAEAPLRENDVAETRMIARNRVSRVARVNSMTGPVFTRTRR